MTRAHLSNFCASTTICAVLAFGSTPAWAQEVASPLDVPAVSAPASPSAAPQPTIHLPDETPAPPAPAAASQPLTQPAPQIAPSAATRDEPAPARSAAERRRPAARSAPEPQPVAAPAPSNREPLPPVASVPLTPPTVTPPPAMTDSQAGAEAASDSDGLPGPTAALAALLAALGLGAGAYATMRTRRRRREERRAYDTGPGPDPVPGIDGPRMASNEPTGGLEPELPLPAYAAIEDAADAPVAPERVAVGMTTEPLPRTREARDALLDKMVSAPPDAENPFTSRKGRMRRARLILQALEHNQKEAASQPFDWRTYKPSTSNPAPATPPRVTA